jgi:hypothetical protein
MNVEQKKLLEVALDTEVANLTAAQKQLIKSNPSELDADEKVKYASVLA